MYILSNIAKWKEIILQEIEDKKDNFEFYLYDIDPSAT